jgi:hypothetical protein
MAASASNFLINKILDFVLRGQAYIPPTTVYVGLMTTTGSQAGPGTEVTGGSYARVALTSNLANWAGTQGATTTAVSSGTSGQTSNNVVITFPAPTANWGTATEWGIFDAPLPGGNMLFRAPLSVSQTITNGAAASSFAISALTWTIT